MPIPGQQVPFLAVFTKEKLWKTLDTAPTIIISETAGSVRIVDGASMAEHPAVPGLYRYLLTLPAGEEKNYIGKCTCTDTDTDYQDTPSFWGDVKSLTQLAGSIGNRALNVQAYDDGTTDPVIDVLVSIVDAVSNPVGVGGITDPAGQTSVMLGDGDYEIRARKAGYTFAAVPVTLAGADLDQTIYGIPYVIQPPVDPGAVAIEEYVRVDNGGEFPVSVSATLRITNIPPDFNGTLLSTKPIAPDYDPVTGTMRWEIPAGVTIQVNIPDHGVRNFTRVVPDVVSVRLLDIPES